MICDAGVLRQPCVGWLSARRTSNDGHGDSKQGRQQREVTQSLPEAVAAQRANSLLSWPERCATQLLPNLSQ